MLHPSSSESFFFCIYPLMHSFFFCIHPVLHPSFILLPSCPGCILPFLYPSCPASFLCCIHLVLHLSFPVIILSCIFPFLYQLFPASFLYYTYPSSSFLCLNCAVPLEQFWRRRRNNAGYVSDRDIVYIGNCDVRCGHKTPQLASSCIESLIKGGNSHHFILASQDGSLRSVNSCIESLIKGGNTHHFILASLRMAH